MIVSRAAEDTNKIRILQLLHLGSKIGFVAASEMETGNTIQNDLTRGTRIRNEGGNSVGGGLKDDEAKGFIPQRGKDQRARGPEVLNAGGMIHPARDVCLRVSSADLFSERA